MKLAQRFLTATAVLLFGMAMYACGGGGSSIAAGTNITQAQFDALAGTSSVISALAPKSQVQQIRIIGYAANQPHSVSGSEVRTYAITRATADGNPCTNMGTVINQDPQHTPDRTYQSCTGYDYTVNAGKGNTESVTAVFYDTAGCTGNAYLAGPGITIGPTPVSDATALATNGYVIQDSNGNYLMLSAGSSSTLPTIASEYYQGACSNTFGYSGQPFFALTTNVPKTTGVSDVVFALPIGQSFAL